MTIRRVLMDAGDNSLAPEKLTGIGLRIAEISEALSDIFTVHIVAPNDETPAELYGVEVAEPAHWSALLDQADVVFFFDCPDPQHLADAVRERKLIVSEATPPIEHAEFPSLLRRPDPARAHRDIVANYQTQLEVSHHFLCGAQVQRITLAANLCLLGRIGPAEIATSRCLHQLISLVPIGYSARSAQLAQTCSPRHLADFLWTGGIWAFYDPLLFVDATARCRSLGKPVTAGFLHAAPHPDNEALLAELHRSVGHHQLADFVHFQELPLSPQERSAHLLGAKGFVSVALPGLENQTCVRLRMRDTRLFGLPTIVDGYGATGTEAGPDPATVVLPEPSVDSVADAMLRIAGDDVPVNAVGREEFAYENTTQGFVTWLSNTLN